MTVPVTERERYLLDLLLDVWRQFALPVTTNPEWKMDGALSTLSMVADTLEAAGYLTRVRDDRDWFAETPFAKER